MTETRRSVQNEQAGRRQAFKIGYLAYQQIAALIATFALIAFLSHFVDFEWKGFVATLVAQWNEYVRPAMKFLLHLLVTVPLGWLGWHVEVPQPFRDYLAVGVITVLSLIREGHRSGIWDIPWKPWDARGSFSGRLYFVIFLWPPAVLFTWPFLTGVMIAAGVAVARPWRWIVTAPGSVPFSCSPRCSISAYSSR